MNTGFASLAVLALAACGAGTWVWRPSEGPHDPKRLRDDIAACEEHREQVEDRGPFPATSGAREHGGWGDPTFELCMRERGWTLRYERSVPADAPRHARR